MTTEERIEKMEQRLARLQSINHLLVVLCIGAVLAMWIFESGTTTAQNRVLNDVSSKAFTLYDEDGNIRAILGTVGDGPTLEFYDRIGTVRAELSVLDNSPYLGLFDDNFKHRAELTVTEAGTILLLKDKFGKTIWSAP